ncbi:MAG: hypothetical protein ACQETB_03935 [Halobacteriota archaeon]
MNAIRRVEPGELSASQILEDLDRGDRVLVSVEVAGQSRTVTLRFDGETYYCDTPTRLLRHETAEAMYECIVDMGYARSE